MIWQKIWKPKLLMTYLNPIVLAEDDDDDCMFFESAVQEMSAGLQLIRYADGMTLMSEIDNVQNPGILFLDINMPKVNGLQCLVELRKQTRYRDLPIIIFSTSASPDQIARLYHAGANGFIVKPNDFNHWKSIIEKSITTDWASTPRRTATDFAGSRITH